MKVAEYVKKNEAALPKELAELLAQETSIWTNDACAGYLIRAMELVGWKAKQINTVLSGLYGAFDDLSVEEAEELWREWR